MTALLLLAATSVLAAPNMLDNGDFEKPAALEGWANGYQAAVRHRQGKGVLA